MGQECYFSGSPALARVAIMARASSSIPSYAAELRQTIAHKLEDAAMMAGDFRFEQFPSSRPEALEGSLLVLLHQRGVANDIGRKNSNKFTVHDRPPCLGRISPHKQYHKLREGALLNRRMQAIHPFTYQCHVDEMPTSL
jgi:hypothetical protein